MAIASVLLVDDDQVLRTTLSEILTRHDFGVTPAATVAEALKYISTGKFHVLLSDLHMPGAGDGLTVISAMRHANPDAVTILLSSFPEMQAATQAILMQTDEILVKPLEALALVEAIKQRLIKGPTPTRVVETVSTILERSTQSTIDDWYRHIVNGTRLGEIPLSRELRCAHLPLLLHDLVVRLRSTYQLGNNDYKSEAAVQHGIDRMRQGYSAAMMVEESRMLQVSIFQTLQNNLGTIDFSILLISVMTIADEVDSQLTQAMESFLAESTRLPGLASHP